MRQEIRRPTVTSRSRPKLAEHDPSDGQYLAGTASGLKRSSGRSWRPATPAQTRDLAIPHLAQQGPVYCGLANMGRRVSRNITLLDHPNPGDSKRRSMAWVLTLILGNELKLTGKAENRIGRENRRGR